MIKSKKLFEIPIYALNRSTLEIRVEKARASFETEYLKLYRSTDCKHDRDCMRSLLYPQRLWDYNHIIGYIVIKANGQDVLLEEYLPHKTVERYHWNAKKKHFVRNQMTLGAHFYIGQKTSQEIKEHILLFVDDFEEKLKERGYFLDREAFDNIVPYIDFKKLVEGDNHGQTQDAQR